jgi:ABC-type multidrug transport system fused ATPase/permease subunit
MCTIDLQDFYDADVRNQINKAQSGYTWQIPNLVESSLDLVYALIRFLAIGMIVAQISWWLIPLVAIFLIPSLLTESTLAKVQWFVWDEKGDERHIFWGLENMTRRAVSQLEMRSMQASKYIQDTINNLNKKFYNKQEKVYGLASRRAVPAKILEIVGVAIGSIYLLKKFLAGSIALDRYFFLSAALLRVGSELNNIFGTLTRMQEPLLYAQNYFSLIDRTPKYIDKPGAIKLEATTTPSIEFVKVCFTYPDQDNAVFKDLDRPTYCPCWRKWCW